MRRPTSFSLLCIWIFFLMTAFDAKSQFDTIPKNAVQQTFDVTKANELSVEAPIRLTYYGDFYKNLKVLPYPSVTRFGAPALNAKGDPLPVVNVVGSILLNILGATSNHPYFGNFNAKPVKQ